MHVLVAVGVAVVVTVRMAMVRVVKCHDAHQIDCETRNADDQEFLDAMHLTARKQSFNSFVDDLHADDHEEDAVGEPRKRVHFAIPVRKSGAGRPLAHDGGTKPDDKSETVEKHVDAVAEKAKRSGEKAVAKLYEHECKIETIIDQLQSINIVVSLTDRHTA
jgi:hypothetical protein